MSYLTPTSSARLAVIFVLLFTAPVSAQLLAESSLPIDIIGDKFEGFEEEGYAVWTGNVQVTQGTAILTTHKLSVYADLDAGEVERLIASGSVRYTNQLEAISGDEGVYDAADGTLRIIGNVVAVRGNQVMSGDSLLYYIDTGQMEVMSGEKQRVRGIFYTNSDKTEHDNRYRAQQ